jgi:hypothetical protein
MAARSFELESAVAGRREQRRMRQTIVRALTFMGVRRKNEFIDAVLQRMPDDWRDDDDLRPVLRAVTNPSTTSDLPAVQSTIFLPLLAPSAASTRLLGMGTKFDLQGLSTIKLPDIAKSGRPPVVFVGEGSPSPTVDLVTGAATLGPTCKVLINCALTSEVQAMSLENASVIVSQALALSTEEALDSVVFSNAAAVIDGAGHTVSPAGLLHGITPIASAGTKGAAGIAADLGLLADKIAGNGVNADDMTVVTTPSLAKKLQVLLGPKYQGDILSSAQLAAGTVIGIVTRGLSVGYGGDVSVEQSNVALVHFEDTTPLPIIGGPPAAPAAPSLSAFQQDLLVLRIRARVAWTIQSAAIAEVTGADW